MTELKGLEKINSESADNIREIAEALVEKVNPLKIILFGSFAKGSYTQDSDYDFYIIIDDSRNVNEATKDAYRASINVKKRPVDIVVGTNSRFELKSKASYTQMVEREVEQHGILLYDHAATPIH